MKELKLLTLFLNGYKCADDTVASTIILDERTSTSYTFSNGPIHILGVNYQS